MFAVKPLRVPADDHGDRMSRIRECSFPERSINLHALRSKALCRKHLAGHECFRRAAKKRMQMVTDDEDCRSCKTRKQDNLDDHIQAVLAFSAPDTRFPFPHLCKCFFRRVYFPFQIPGERPGY